MSKFIHLSDLHFGPRFHLHLGDVILKEIEMQNPDAVILSGDFTLRAQHNEYQEARAYIERITKPKLMIPGNHDQPLFEPFERLTASYARYMKYICPTVDATLAVADLYFVGLSDCRPILPGGFWSAKQRAWITEQLAAAPKRAVKIVVSHHQFLWSRAKMRPAGFWYPTHTLKWLAEQGVEMVLGGHTHIPVAVRTDQEIIVAGAGTATSVRTRHGWGNTYNVVQVDPQQILISICQYDEQAGAFKQTQAHTFPRRIHSG